MTVNQRDLFAMILTMEMAKQGGLEPAVYNEDQKVVMDIYDHMRKVVEELDVERTNDVKSRSNQRTG